MRQSDVAAFAAQISGGTLTAADAGYDEARKVWNATVDRRPALADAYIAAWDSKFQHNVWRPVTAIHLAGTDGNPNTTPDAGFDPLLTTPPVPDLPSTHSVLGMAAATVLTQAFGSDHVPFSFASSSALPANPVRSYRGFVEAARENADSRVKAGLHFRFATTAGLEMGRQIGQYISRNALPSQGGAAAREE